MRTDFTLIQIGFATHFFFIDSSRDGNRLPTPGQPWWICQGETTPQRPQSVVKEENIIICRASFPSHCDFSHNSISLQTISPALARAVKGNYWSLQVALEPFMRARWLAASWKNNSQWLKMFPSPLPSHSGASSSAKQTCQTIVSVTVLLGTRQPTAPTLHSSETPDSPPPQHSIPLKLQTAHRPNTLFLRNSRQPTAPTLHSSQTPLGTRLISAPTLHSSQTPLGTRLISAPTLHSSQTPSGTRQPTAPTLHSSQTPLGTRQTSAQTYP